MHKDLKIPIWREYDELAAYYYFVHHFCCYVYSVAQKRRIER